MKSYQMVIDKSILKMSWKSPSQTATAWPFVELDEKGIAYVQGTTTKVIESPWISWPTTWTRTRFIANIRICRSRRFMPRGYYHEHREDCDRQIEERRQRADALLKQLENPELQERLRRLKAEA